MDARELRIGNWALHKYQNFGAEGFYFAENVISSDDIKGCEEFLEAYKPIPLTEEWLIKFEMIRMPKVDELEWLNSSFNERGYTFAKHKYYCSEYFVSIDKDGIDFEIFSSDDGMESREHLSKLEYVHQLQNLYFALTQKELTIKD